MTETNKSQKMLCPLCDTELTWLPKPVVYKPNEHVTHIYVCPECPFVGFEYLNDRNIVDVRDYLNRK